MANIHIYKDAAGNLNASIPAAKENIQASLNNVGLQGYIAGHTTAKEYEQSAGLDYSVHDRRIAWANSVVDFSNITDLEYQANIECDMPANTQYNYWIDQSLVALDQYFSAATDIDQTGHITYDMDKAKQIQAVLMKTAQDAAAAKAALDAEHQALVNSITATTIEELRAEPITTP